MELQRQIQLWQDFFTEGVTGTSGEIENLENLEKTENSIINEILQILENLQDLRFSIDLCDQYLATKGSLQYQALTYYLLYDALTDKELGEKLGFDKEAAAKRAADIRKKESIAKFIEAKETGRKPPYGLTAKATLLQEEELRRWLKSYQDAEARSHRLEEERAKEQILGGKIPDCSGSLRADIAEQFRKGDYAVTIQFSELAEFSNDLADVLLNNPLEVLLAAEMSLKSFDFPKPYGLDRIEFVIKGLPDSSKTTLSRIGTEDVGKLIELIVEPEMIGEIMPLCLSARYECPSCGNIIPVLQNDQKFKEPTGCGCGRKGKFREISKELTDSRLIRVSQPIGEVLNGQPRNPKPLHVKGLLAKEKYINKIGTGRPCRVVAVPDIAEIILSTGGRSTRFALVLKAISFESIDDYNFDLNFSDEEIKEFEAAAKSENFLEDFAESCFPGHYKDEHIKKACALQLFVGRFDQRVDDECLNIFLSGDPGTGKTRNFLRRAADKLAPIGRFVIATTGSKAGLLGSVEKKDPDTGTRSLEPGALSRANRGLVALDELSAFTPEDSKALNEAIDSGRITIDKSGVHTVAEADNAVLAAANPVDGRFPEGRPVTAKDLGIDQSTLNRFDLVYLMLDTPKYEKDLGIARKINRRSVGKATYLAKWIKRYVIYARHKIYPVLGNEDAGKLEEFYANMRQCGLKGDSEFPATLSISPRQFEALRALTLLSAKAVLRNNTCHKDVELAIELMEPMLNGFYFDITKLQRWGIGKVV